MTAFLAGLRRECYMTAKRKAMGAQRMTRKMPVKTSADERSVEAHNEVAAGARDILFARLRAQPVQDLGRWTREELYKDRRSQS
jgi:hypothetical protein